MAGICGEGGNEGRRHFHLLSFSNQALPNITLQLFNADQSQI